MKIGDIITQLRDESPQIKLKGLKELQEIQDFSGYPANTLLDLSEILSEHREYFNPSVQMLAARNYDRVQVVITDLMKSSPDAIARSAANSLIDDDDEPEAPPRPGPRSATPPTRSDPEKVEVDFTTVEEKAQTAAAAVNKPADPAVDAKAAKPARAAAARPQMLIVYSDSESRLAKVWNVTFGLLATLLTLAYAWTEVRALSDIGYAAIGAAALFVALLFTPSRIFPSYNKLRVALFGFVAVTAFLFYRHGFAASFSLMDFIPKEFRGGNLLDHFDANLTKFAILAWFLVPTYMIVVDEAPAAGTKFFLFLFALYSSAAVVENILHRGTVDMLIGEQGFFKIIPFPYVRPFYFGVNALLPMAFIVGAFIFLRELFQLSLRRMIGALLIAATAAAAGGCLFYNLRQSPYPNLADFFYPRTLEGYKGKLAKGIHQSVIDEGNIEPAIQDALAGEKGVIFKGDSPTAEVKLEPEVLLPESAGEPSLSPNGLYLAFTQSDGKKSDIKFMRLQSREVVPLVSDNAKNREPVFSPDSSRIAYLSDVDGQDNVWIIGTNKQGSRQLTMSSGAKSHLTWAGDWIAYDSNGSIIRYPVQRDAPGQKPDIKERLKIFNTVASLVLKTTVNANVTLDGGRITIGFRTSEGNEARIFRQIYAALVVAAKVFAGYESQISAYEVKAQYLTHEIVVATIPDIVKINLVDFDYLSEEKVNVWIKTSEITRNGEPYLKEK